MGQELIPEVHQTGQEVGLKQLHLPRHIGFCRPSRKFSILFRVGRLQCIERFKRGSHGDEEWH